MESSSESSSASSSDTSSSSSSSGDSDSSSSSDTDSSSSQNTDKKSPEPKTAKKPNEPKTNTSNKTTPSAKVVKPKPKPRGKLFSSEDEDVKENLKKKKTVKKSGVVVGQKSMQLKPQVKATSVLKSIAKPAVKAVKKEEKGGDGNKKKSIFSPENSSESDSKTTKHKPRPKADARAVEKPKTPNKPKPTPKPKPSLSSATSTDSSSSSDSESSTASTTKTIKKESNSESETNKQRNKQTVRKSTRTTTGPRKSKHLLGKNVYTDTDSDTERSLSRSPVKRAAAVAKGKMKGKQPKDSKAISGEAGSAERKCPLEGCSSLGHLSGRHEKHFTVDACPMYHNMTAASCREQAAERKKREEFRRKATEAYKRSFRNAPNPEQKQYGQKIKDLRSKFKSEGSEDVKPVFDKNKEPNLTNIVPDYDLKLFRDAQAIASESVEEDLLKQPSTKGLYMEMIENCC